MRLDRIARERRHTLSFLRWSRAVAPVFLDTEIDMTRVRQDRASVQEGRRRCSVITYVLYTAGRVLARHPEANAAIGGWPAPRIARYESASGKLTLDKTLNGHRIVLTAVLRELDRRDLDDIQGQVERLRDGDPALLPEFAGARALHRLPWPLGAAASRLALGSLGRRPQVMGTFAVTSLGHRPVDGFQSVGGTTITLGLGRVVDRPVARDGQVVVAPIMRLSLAFDHRVIDGAEAADVLSDIKQGLEDFAPARARSTAMSEAVAP